MFCDPKRWVMLTIEHVVEAKKKVRTWHLISSLINYVNILSYLKQIKSFEFCK